MATAKVTVKANPFLNIKRKQKFKIRKISSQNSVDMKNPFDFIQSFSSQ